jgi:hypothetical protein
MRPARAALAVSATAPSQFTHPSSGGDVDQLYEVQPMGVVSYDEVAGKQAASDELEVVS